MSRKQVHIYTDTLPASIRDLIEFYITSEGLSPSKAVRKIITNGSGDTAIDLKAIQKELEGSKDMIAELRNQADIWGTRYAKLAERLVESATVNVDMGSLPLNPLSPTVPKALQPTVNTSEYKGHRIRRLNPLKETDFQNMYPDNYKTLLNIKKAEPRKLSMVKTRVFENHKLILDQAEGLMDFTIEKTIEFINSSTSIVYLEDIQAILLAITKDLHKFKDMLSKQKASSAPYDEKWKKFTELNEFFCEYVFTSTAFKYPWTIPVDVEDMVFRWDVIYEERFC